MAQNIKDAVARAKKAFKKAQEVAAQTFAKVEDGVYRAKIESAKLGVSGKGNLQSIIQFKVVGGEAKGEKFTQFSQLENEVGQGIFLRQLQSLGFEIEGFDEIENILAELNKDKPVVRVKAKTDKNDFQNYTMERILDGEEAEEGDDDDAPAASEAEAEVEPEAEAEAEAEAEPADEPAEEPAEEGAVELGEGSKVSFTVKGEKMNGEIVEVVDENTVRVKGSDGKTYRVKAENLEPAKEPVKKVVKKVKR